MVLNTHKLTVTLINLLMKTVKIIKISIPKNNNKKLTIKVKLSPKINISTQKQILLLNNMHKDLKIVFLKTLTQSKPLIKYGDFTDTFSNMITLWNG